MNRSIAILMLVQFVAQHFACCCTGCDSAPQKSNQTVSVSSAGQRPCRSSGCCHRHHDRRTQPLAKNTQPTKNAAPTSHDHHNGSSQHHLCFASHIVFNATGRAMIAPSDLSSGDFLLPPDSLRRKLLESCAIDRVPHDAEPWGFTCHERSLLGVYRI